MDISKYLKYSKEQIEAFAKEDVKHAIEVRNSLFALWQSGNTNPVIGDKYAEFSEAITKSMPA